MTDKEALKLALEALEIAVGDDGHDYQKYLDAVDALKEALAQPAQRTEQEPAPWAELIDENQRLRAELKFNTTPPQRKPLTDEQIEAVWRNVQANDFHDCVQPFARAIEAAHGIKEKNT